MVLLLLLADPLRRPGGYQTGGEKGLELLVVVLVCAGREGVGGVEMVLNERLVGDAPGCLLGEDTRDHPIIVARLNVFVSPSDGFGLAGTKSIRPRGDLDGIKGASLLLPPPPPPPQQSGLVGVTGLSGNSILGDNVLCPGEVSSYSESEYSNCCSSPPL